MTTMPQRTAAAVRFVARLHTAGSQIILRLPARVSEELPSRGQVAVSGTINGHDFQTVLEPDGDSGHWMKVAEPLQQAAGIGAGDMATVDMAPTKNWPEPHVPRDLQAALAAAPQRIQDIWKDVTPTARWEWVRWVEATNNPDTRQRRVEVSISKLNGGKRRPCCFDLSACTDPQLSRNGRLIDSARG